MKIRITEPGWENFTGYMAEIEFDQAVSVEDVNAEQAARIAANVRAELEDGSNPSVSQALTEISDIPAPTEEKLKTLAQMQAEQVASVETPSDAPKAAPEAAPAPQYSREQLEVIADNDGIAGLREIGNQFGVKGQSIASLIDGIVAAQAK